MEHDNSINDRCNFFGAFGKVYMLFGAEDYIFYIGSTMRPMHQRLDQHISESRSRTGNQKKGEIIRWFNYKISYILLENLWLTGANCYEVDLMLLEKEAYWIGVALERGYPICNSHYVKKTLEPQETKQTA